MNNVGEGKAKDTSEGGWIVRQSGGPWKPTEDMPILHFWWYKGWKILALIIIVLLGGDMLLGKNKPWNSTNIPQSPEELGQTAWEDFEKMAASSKWNELFVAFDEATAPQESNPNARPECTFENVEKCYHIAGKRKYRKQLQQELETVNTRDGAKIVVYNYTTYDVDIAAIGTMREQIQDIISQMSPTPYEVDIGESYTYQLRTKDLLIFVVPDTFPKPDFTDKDYIGLFNRRCTTYIMANLNMHIIFVNEEEHHPISDNRGLYTELCQLTLEVENDPNGKKQDLLCNSIALAMQLKYYPEFQTWKGYTGKIPPEYEVFKLEGFLENKKYTLKRLNQDMWGKIPLPVQALMEQQNE
jgi:hypothetical protein